MSKLKKNLLFSAAVVIPLMLAFVLLYMMNKIAGTDFIFSQLSKINSSVINQSLFIFALCVFGLAVMMNFNRYFSKLKIIMLSLPVGTLIWCLSSVVVVCTGIAFTWYWTAAVSLLFLAVLFFLLRPKKPVKEDVVFYIKALVIFASLSFFFSSLCVFRFSYDSYMYINTGIKIAKLGYLPYDLAEIVSGFSLFTAMLYSPAVFFNFDFSQGLNFMLNIQFTVFVGYAVYDFLKDRVSTKASFLVGVLSAVVLASSNIYFELLYWPMSNILTAMTLFGIVYFSKQAMSGDSKANMILAAIFGMSFVLIRSENMLLYICVMFLVSLSEIDKKHLSLNIASAAVALSLWYFRFFMTAGLSFSEGAFLTVDRAIQLIAVFAMFTLYVMFLSKTKFIESKKRIIEILFFSAMGLAIVLLSVLKPDFFVTNMQATIVNIFYDGSWGGALIIIFALYAVKLSYTKKADFYDKTILAFVLFYIIIFLLREMELRIGFGDSGNRYFAHILPVLVYSVSIVLSNIMIKPKEGLNIKT